MAMSDKKKAGKPRAPSAKAPQARGSTPGGNQAGLDRDELLRGYRDMLLIRRFEEKAGQLYGMGLIGGFCHLYIGQEAVVVGMQMALGEGDQVITSYRDHGHMLATGMEARGVMAELTGRSGGYSKGKGGSMHMFSKERNFFGGHGIVGAQVSLGTGLAFSNHYRGNDRVCVTYFGDGAANQGQVFESFNLAALFKLPCIYVIENNKYGMGTSVDRATASRNLSHNRRRCPLPRRVGAISARSANLSLSRSFHVRSGSLSFAGGSATHAHRTRLHRTCQAETGNFGCARGTVQGNR